MDQIRPRLEAFAAQMLGGLARQGQQAKGELYLRGLLLDGQRKSMQPMAARLGVDHQRLQQFIASSTWDVEPVRATLARWAVPVIDPDAYVIDDSGFPKDGTASPCVARQYGGALGKRANCQVAVSVQMVTDQASLAANWRLFCPESWDDATIEDADQAQAVRRRRLRAHLPDAVRHRQKWRLALDLLDQMTDQWGLPRLPVTADSGYGDATAFRLGLQARGYAYVVAVKPTTSAYAGDAVPQAAPYGGRGRPAHPGYREEASTLRELARAAGRTATHQVTWRHGTRKTSDNPTAALTSRFLALRVRPANRDIPRGSDGSLPAAGRMAPRRLRAQRLRAVQPGRRGPPAGPGAPGQDPLADRTRLP